jgi:hypothetical protein
MREVAILGDLHQPFRFVAVGRLGDGTVFAHVWDVDPATGALTRAGNAAIGDGGSNLRLTSVPRTVSPQDAFPSSEYATSSTVSTGGWIRDFRVAATGAITLTAFHEVAGAKEVDLAGFGESGVLEAAVIGGRLHLRVSEGPGTGMLAVPLVSDHDTGLFSRQVRVCSVPAVDAAGAFVTGALVGSPAILRVDPWLVAPRP